MSFLMQKQVLGKSVQLKQWIINIKYCNICIIY